MEITSATATTSASAATTGTGALTSDFQTFLVMLTTQLQNQNPLNPMESSEFAVQLATFSGVEQQLRTNEILSDLSGSLGASGVGAYAGWIGKQARSEAPAWFEGQPLTLYPPADSAAERMQLVVTDPAGVELQRVEIGTDGAPVTWAGTGPGGIPLADGLYQFSAVSVSGGVTGAAQPVEAYGRVTEAQAGSDGPLLILEHGQAVAADKVTALRD